MSKIIATVEWPGGRFDAELLEDRGNGVCLMRSIGKHPRVDSGHPFIANKKNIRDWKDEDGNKVPAP